MIQSQAITISFRNQTIKYQDQENDERKYSEDRLVIVSAIRVVHIVIDLFSNIFNSLVLFLF